MTNIDQGTYAAKRASWREANPRKLLRQLVESDQEAGDWADEMWAKIKKDLSDNGILRATFQYWYDNNIRSLMPDVAGTRPPRTRQIETTQHVAASATRFRTLLLLNLVMPNGKILGDCTGSECRHFTGWFTQLAKLVPARKKVSDVLSEDKLQELWAKV